MFRLSILSTLSAIGFLASSYQSYHFYESRGGESSFKSFCNINATFNCDLISSSRFAELFWGIPLSSAAAGWFSALFFITWLARNPYWKREALRGSLVLTAGASVFSLFYLFIMAFVLKTYCLVCFLIDAVSFSSLLLVSSLKPEGFKEHKLDRQKWKMFAGTFAASLILSVVGLKFLDPSVTPNSQLRDVYKNAAQTIIYSPPVAVQVDDTMPFFGSKEAPITIVEFSDFQCPHCKKGAFIMNSLLNRYPGKLKIVPRHFPLDASCNRSLQSQGHSAACESAKAVLCAAEQRKFEALYEALFESQNSLAPGVPQKLAQQAGLDVAKLSQCMEAPETSSKISKDIEEALLLGIQSTPTFFINGRKVEGAYTFDVWSEVVDLLLKGGN